MLGTYWRQLLACHLFVTLAQLYSSAIFPLLYCISAHQPAEKKNPLSSVAAVIASADRCYWCSLLYCLAECFRLLKSEIFHRQRVEAFGLYSCSLDVSARHVFYELYSSSKHFFFFVRARCFFFILVVCQLKGQKN